MKLEFLTTRILIYSLFLISLGIACTGNAKAQFASALVLDQAAYTQLTDQYKKDNPETTLGGEFSVADIRTLLNSMPSGDQFINFRFAIDPSSGHPILLLRGSKRWYQSTSHIVCVRNGASASSFCPTNCDWQNSSEPLSITLNYDSYEDLAEVYQENHTGKTWGGNIDRGAIMQLLESIPESQNFLAFMFCTDPIKSKTAVIFVGGTEKQANNKQLFFRNGKDEASYCPTSCGIRD